MRIAKTSQFKNLQQDKTWFENWVTRLETLNGKKYQRFQQQTTLGKTHVWGLNSNNESLASLVIFPGARTTSLFWDFDNGLNHLFQKLRIFLVETNGLPNLSDSSTPDIRTLGYGEWAFSLSWRNLYYNLLPIFSPSGKNVLTFLDKAIFSKPNHQLSAKAEELIIDYEVFALTRCKDNTQKPYDMGNELRQVKIDTFLLEVTTIYYFLILRQSQMQKTESNR